MIAIFKSQQVIEKPYTLMEYVIAQDTDEEKQEALLDAIDIAGIRNRYTNVIVSYELQPAILKVRIDHD